jgi:cytochrome o ubiquinol oxidase subunit 3
MRQSQEVQLATEQIENEAKTTLGFWIYLMTDCVLFATLFATYAVLHSSVNGGPSGKELFHLPLVLVETTVLLTSSFTSGLALIAARSKDKNQVLLWLGVTGALGLVFLGIELSEFRSLALEGNSWRHSGFLSAFFTLVGTHGLHITAGLLWLGVLLSRILKKGLTSIALRRLTLFTVFWHFLDLIWIFIFTIVYMSGGLGL